MSSKFSQFILTASLLTIAVNAQQTNVVTKQVEIKIYLQRTIVETNGNNFNESAFVKRKIDAKSPLRSTLEWLFSPKIIAEEDRQNFYSSTFGVKFEGVVLKNGTAMIKFSQPPNETNYGSE